MSNNSRENIIHKARQLFTQQGFDGVSMSQVAKACQLNKATLYHHFASKEELYLQVVQAMSIDILARLSQISQTGTWQERLEAAAVDLAQIISTSGIDLLMLIRDLRHFSLDARASWREQLGDMALAPLVAAIQGGRDAGELKADLDPIFAAWTLTAMVTVGARPLMKQPDLAQVRQAIAIFLDGVRRGG